MELHQKVEGLVGEAQTIEAASINRIRTEGWLGYVGSPNLSKNSGNLTDWKHFRNLLFYEDILARAWSCSMAVSSIRSERFRMIPLTSLFCSKSGKNADAGSSNAVERAIKVSTDGMDLALSILERLSGVRSIHSPKSCWVNPFCWGADLIVWDAGPNQLLVWEAFVSGSSKGSDHWHDADIAAGSFLDGLSDMEAINAIEEPNVLSLVGVALIHSGWVEASGSILKTPALVAKP